MCSNKKVWFPFSQGLCKAVMKKIVIESNLENVAEGRRLSMRILGFEQQAESISTATGHLHFTICEF